MSSNDLYKEGYLCHSPPVYKEHHDDVPSHFEIDNETGYFPAAAASSTQVASIRPATLYQMHPSYDKQVDHPIASGILVLNDPDDGTANEVALVGECEGISFFLLQDDATTKISETEFMLLLPNDCILVDVAGASPDTILHMEAVLAARTQFHDETQVRVDGTEEEKEELVYPDILPDDKVSRGIYRTSKFMSRMIVGASGKAAKGIHAYGERRKESITETQEKRVSQTSIKMAKATRRVSDTTLRVSVKVSDKISTVIGGGVGKAVAPKDTDSSSKKKARELLLASTIAVEQVSGGMNEGYELMVQAAKSQATSFVAKKYGEDAAELARHTAGSAANFGRTALTARRIVNVKKIAKSAGKNAVKSYVKQSLTK